MNSKTVGQRIAQARVARGLSQTELAKLAGFKTQSGIGNIENRKDGRGGFSLVKIAAVLRVRVEWLLNGPDSEIVPFSENETSDTPVSHKTQNAGINAHTPAEKAISLLRQLPPQALKEAVQYLEYLSVKYQSPSTDGADLSVSAPTRKSA